MPTSAPQNPSNPSSPRRPGGSRWSPRSVAGLAVSAALVVALLLVAFLAPLPYTVMVPGDATDALGRAGAKPVISVAGHPVRTTTGSLRTTTIGATLPDARITLVDAVRAWFRDDQAVVPKEAVYPAGKTDRQLDRLNASQMHQSQDAATAAALHHLGLSPHKVRVTVNLPDVGGPSAGLMFTLGIIDKLDGDGHGHDLTGGRDVAGTGTVSKAGKVGPVGGVTLKTQAARKAGATVFLVPKAECTQAKGNLPHGLRLVPVGTVDGALHALTALRTGSGTVPHC